jgi:hypothetical protein
MPQESPRNFLTAPSLLQQPDKKEREKALQRLDLHQRATPDPAASSPDAVVHAHSKRHKIATCIYSNILS